MAKAKTTEEKLAVAHAKAEMFRAEANRVGLLEYDVRQKLGIESAKWAAEKQHLEAKAKGLEEALRLERADTNGLRTIVRDLELTVERHRGYADGQLDAQPPAMVPEQREFRRATWPYPQSEVFDDRGPMNSGNGRYGSQKGWWMK